LGKSRERGRMEKGEKNDGYAGELRVPDFKRREKRRGNCSSFTLGHTGDRVCRVRKGGEGGGEAVKSGGGTKAASGGKDEESPE